MKKDNLTIIITVIALFVLVIVLAYSVVGDTIKEKLNEKKEESIAKQIEEFQEEIKIVIENKDELNIPESFDVESSIKEYILYSGHEFDSYNIELEYFKEDVTIKGRWIFKIKDSNVRGDAYNPDIVNVYGY